MENGERDEQPEERLVQQLDPEDFSEKDRSELAQDRTTLALERSEMAQQRTDWAEHRTLLANERNFSAWLRTGLSAMGGGLAVARFLGGDEETGLIPRGIGVFLVLFGASVCALAVWRYNQISDLLEHEGLRITPKWAVGLLVGALAVIAVMLLVLIFA